jgi:predicted AAA+ superfamily ATPase
MFSRQVRSSLLASARESPVVFLRGPRQTGKTTLVRSISVESPGFQYLTSATVTSADFSGLRDLAAGTEDRFVRGIILYLGEEVVPFGPNLHAVPLTALWEW